MENTKIKKHLTQEEKEKLLNVFTVVVDHEIKMLKHLTNPNSQSYLYNGIVETVKMKKAQKGNLKELLNDFKKVVNTEEEYNLLNKGLKLVKEQQVEKVKENNYKITYGEAHDIVRTLQKFTGTKEGSYKLFKETSKGQRKLSQWFVTEMTN